MRSFVTSLASLAIAFPCSSLAFLVPPGLDVDIARGSVPPASEDLIQKTVAVNCADCPFFETSVDGMEIWSKRQNSLILEFSTKPGILNVNGHPLLTPQKPRSFTPLTAVQVPSEAKNINVNTFDGKSGFHEVVLGFEVYMARIHPGVVNAKLHVLSVGFMRTARSMNIVELSLIDDGKGGFLIFDILVREPTMQEAYVARCGTNFLCRMKTFFADTISRLQNKKPECHNPHMLPPASTAEDSENTPSPYHTDLLEIFKHHYQKLKSAQNIQYDGHKHKMSIMCKVFRYVLMPLILTGIVGTIGFTVGLLFYLVYSKLFKNRSEARSDKLDMLEEQGLLNEKACEIDSVDEEPLPAYTDSHGELRE